MKKFLWIGLAALAAFLLLRGKKKKTADDKNAANAPNKQGNAYSGGNGLTNAITAATRKVAGDDVGNLLTSFAGLFGLSGGSNGGGLSGFNMGGNVDLTGAVTLLTKGIAAGFTGIGKGVSSLFTKAGPTPSNQYTRSNDELTSTGSYPFDPESFAVPINDTPLDRNFSLDDFSLVEPDPFTWDNLETSDFNPDYSGFEPDFTSYESSIDNSAEYYDPFTWDNLEMSNFEPSF